MSKERVPHNRYVSDGLHPHVYLAMVGLAAWYALSAWIGFGDGGYTDYLLVVMTGFIIISVALPAFAGRVWLRHHHRSDTAAHSFEDWIAGEFDTGQGRVSAKTALVELLLPLAAVAFGMTAFAIMARLAG
ncbi:MULTISPECIES: hypothetical protein [unclassified Mesorhizobium]|uniref:hypothetical protein n=1 Tax=unclassified Mesorhizobium TaxID=325217 RepID=UPI000F75E461|nr:MULTISPECIES: hypothetical protein [unclassified Mesorhizobium]AZO65598.1 hypothetical protein EJ075_11865 [Mesorhizobium sp. M6A.T.Cr.TU.016.01.1.1]RUU32064.1 hypothetical protein EOC94_00875 [Mesorhizobium sp. M6A.T.Ce.TU.016.01.1.1]RWP55027.1 MAG: hypothetical protein EOR06_08010 [Mesorhizobium sp.]RWQ43451.1 MAG: hypothetical protein EOS21_05265 [Mesorhizobium sp.]RWQ87537.1 MAG: hypothetical protein EOS85_05585 [Mesorhizobium sp.]